MKTTNSLRALASAIIAAVEEHGAPNSFGLPELHALYGAPHPMTCGRLAAEIRSLRHIIVQMRPDAASWAMRGDEPNEGDRRLDGYGLTYSPPSPTHPARFSVRRRHPPPPRGGPHEE
jgi:hypothetical protein